MKRPLTLEEQIQYLKENKNVVFNVCSEEEAEKILLAHNYINVITPFKYNFCSGLDSENKHIYPREVDFQEYYQKYKEEREQYPKLLSNILKFEHQLNAVFSYYVIHHYNIDSITSFNNMISELQINKSTIEEKYHKVIDKVLTNLTSEFNEKYSQNIYVTFNRLSLGKMLLIFRVLPSRVKNEIVKYFELHPLVRNHQIDQFQKKVHQIQEIRNCVAHNNSLEIRVKYYNIEMKRERNSHARRRYRELITLIKECNI